MVLYRVNILGFYIREYILEYILGFDCVDRSPEFYMTGARKEIKVREYYCAVDVN